MRRSWGPWHKGKAWSRWRRLLDERKVPRRGGGGVHKAARLASAANAVASSRLALLLLRGALRHVTSFAGLPPLRPHPRRRRVAWHRWRWSFWHRRDKHPCTVWPRLRLRSEQMRGTLRGRSTEPLCKRSQRLKAAAQSHKAHSWWRPSRDRWCWHHVGHGHTSPRHRRWIARRGCRCWHRARPRHRWRGRYTSR